MRRAAFTLIEMLAVVILVGLLAGAVTVSFADRHHTVRLGDVVDRIATFDRTARTVAVRFGRQLALRFDLTDHSMIRLNATTLQPDAEQIRLPNGYRFLAVRTAEISGTLHDLAVPITPHGTAPTYAIRIGGPTWSRWIVFAGLTGQTLVTEDDDTIDQTFNLLQ